MRVIIIDIFVIQIIRWCVIRRKFTGKNLLEARILATCLAQGDSQRGMGSFLSIQCHACHGESHVTGRNQNKLI